MMQKPQAKLDKLDRQREDVAKLEKELQMLRAKATSTTEKDYLDEYIHLFVTLQAVARKMERKVLKEPQSRDIYALSTLYSQLREVIADVRSITDMGQQVEMIVAGAITPFASDITQCVTDVYYQVRKLLRETTKPKETQFALNHLDELVRQLGMGIQQSHERARTKVVEVLLGEPDKPKPKRKKV